MDLSLPMDLVVCHTSDAASPVLNPEDEGNTGQNVASMVARKYNKKLFKQHCAPHRLSLNGKDGQEELPDFVEETLQSLYNHTKYSCVAQSMLKQCAVEGMTFI